MNTRWPVLLGELTTASLPIRFFDVEHFGLSRDAIQQELAPTFLDLDWDYYDVRRLQLELLRARLRHAFDEIAAITPRYLSDAESAVSIAPLLASLPAEDRAAILSLRPFRRRAIARFVMTALGGWHGLEQSHQSFVQGTPDWRALPRIFQKMRAEVVHCSSFQKLLHGVCEMMREIQPTASAIEVTAHQICTIARDTSPGDNSPEGIHQDDADYIVSAVVVERRNVRGGLSRIFASDQRSLLKQHTLQVGEGILHADRGSPLWHDVTPVCVDDPAKGSEGLRSIFGFDINILAS